MTDTPNGAATLITEDGLAYFNDFHRAGSTEATETVSPPVTATDPLELLKAAQEATQRDLEAIPKLIADAEKRKRQIDTDAKAAKKVLDGEISSLREQEKAILRAINRQRRSSRKRQPSTGKGAEQ